jgi:hypothetical protein
MNWYDAGEPPFGRGKKQKEFPDALAIAILSAYAEQNTCYIAIVSQDQDMKKACDRFSSLMYFQSLPVLTELLLSAEDSRIATFRAVLDGSSDKLTEAAYEATIDLSFYHNGDYSHIEDSEIRALNIADVRIVALGEHECTVAFDAVIDVRHRVEWSEPGPDGEEDRRRETVTNDYDLSGTAKISFDATTNQVAGIPYVAFDSDEVETKDIPPLWDRWR